MLYEKLLIEADWNKVEVYEELMKPRIKGLYSDNIIWINKIIPNNIEKACVLAEELGHYHTSTDDILDQSKLLNRKQEKRARSWAYKRLMPLPKIIEAYKAGVRNRYEMADYLGVTEIFIEDAIDRYKEEFGLYVPVGKYTIYFEPLGVLEKFKY